MKKISPSMVEAGVAALQRNTKMSEPSLVSKIYSVMEEVRVRDELAMKAAPHGYVHQPYPGWRYGPGGEKALFNSAEDVPEGWTTAPPTKEEIEAHAAHAEKNIKSKK